MLCPVFLYVWQNDSRLIIFGHLLSLSTLLLTLLIFLLHLVSNGNHVLTDDTWTRIGTQTLLKHLNCSIKCLEGDMNKGQVVESQDCQFLTRNSIDSAFPYDSFG